MHLLLTLRNTFLIIGLAVSTTACKTTEEPISNGYLENYQQLENITNEDGVTQQRWTSRKLTRKVNPIKPTSFYIKPIVYYPQLPDDAQISKQVSRELADYLHSEMKRTAAKHFMVTNTIEDGTFVVEPAITSMRISLETLSPLEVIPFRAVLSSINYAMGGRDRDVEMRLETKVIAADQQELVATTVHRGQGIQLENDQEQLTQAHVKQLIDAWVASWDANLAAYKQQLAGQ